MRWLILAGLLAANEIAAQTAPGAQYPDFSPPPVPEFMPRKPQKPLTLEEMQKQAEEAARRARAERERQALPAKPLAQAGSGKIR